MAAPQPNHSRHASAQKRVKANAASSMAPTAVVKGMTYTEKMLSAATQLFTFRTCSRMPLWKLPSPERWSSPAGFRPLRTMPKAR